MEAHGRDATPDGLKDEVHSHVRAILEVPDEETARMLLRKTKSFHEDKASETAIIPVSYTHLSVVEIHCLSHIPKIHLTS